MENIHLFFNTMKLYANLITEFEPYISYKYDFMNVFQKKYHHGISAVFICTNAKQYASHKIFQLYLITFTVYA